MNEVVSRAAEDPTFSLREKLENLINECAFALDDEDIDRWPHFFNESATYHVTTRENYDDGLPIGVIHCVGRGMMLDRVKAFHTANIFEPHHYNHVLGRPSFSAGETAETYKARCNFQVSRIMRDGRSELFATGKYLDTIVLENGVPRFQERIVVLDSRHVDILLVIPL